MDFVAEGRQLDPQLGGNHPGAAVGGITGDSNAHGALLSLDCLYVMDVWREMEDAGIQQVSESAAASQAGKSGASQIAEGDEVDGGEFFERGESLAFDVARCAEAGADARQVGVVIAGVGDELPCACGHLSK